MSRRLDPEFKNLTPLELSQKAGECYKAFCFQSQDPDMVVNMDADSFAPSIPAAIRLLFNQTLTSTDVAKVPHMRLIYKVAEEKYEDVKLERHNENDLMRNVLVIKLNAYQVDEFRQSIIGSPTDDEIVLKLKDMVHGYVSNLQMYNVEELTMRAESKTSNRWQLHTAKLTVVDPDRASPSFPVEIIMNESDEIKYMEMRFSAVKGRPPEGYFVGALDPRYENKIDFNSMLDGIADVFDSDPMGEE